MDNLYHDRISIRVRIGCLWKSWIICNMIGYLLGLGLDVYGNHPGCLWRSKQGVYEGQQKISMEIRIGLLRSGYRVPIEIRIDCL